MRRAAFTLIELLTIIAIMGTMVAVGIVSWQRGKSRAQLAGATRDILAVVRQARSIALVTQKPAIITYATEKDEDDVPFARITVETAKLFDDSSANVPVYTLSGERVGGDPEPTPAAPQASTDSDAQSDASGTEGGESLSDILMPKIALDVVKGLRIKVLKEDEQLMLGNGPITYKSGISVFSTSGAVRNELGKSSAKSAPQTPSPDSDNAASEGPVEIVWSTNGRADGHTIWIYPDGSQPEKGLSIVVDRFGGCKVSQWEDEE